MSVQGRPFIVPFWSFRLPSRYGVFLKPSNDPMEISTTKSRKVPVIGGQMWKFQTDW